MLYRVYLNYDLIILVRFTTRFINPQGEIQIGIFMAIKYLREDYSLTNDDDIIELKKLINWFNANLEKPTRFSNGTSACL